MPTLQEAVTRIIALAETCAPDAAPLAAREADAYLAPLDRPGVPDARAELVGWLEREGPRTPGMQRVIAAVSAGG